MSYKSSILAVKSYENHFHLRKVTIFILNPFTLLFNLNKKQNKTKKVIHAEIRHKYKLLCMEYKKQN